MNKLKDVLVRAVDLEALGISIAYTMTDDPARLAECKRNAEAIAAAIAPSDAAGAPLGYVARDAAIELQKGSPRQWAKLFSVRAVGVPGNMQPVYAAPVAPAAPLEPNQIQVTHTIATDDNCATILHALLDSFVEVAAAFPDAKVEDSLARQVRVYLPNPEAIDPIDAPVDMNRYQGRHAYAAGWNDCRAHFTVAPTTVAPAAVAPNDERAAFEAWIATLDDKDEIAWGIRHGIEGEEESAWAAWQARARTAAPTPTVAADAAAPSEDAYVAQRMTETLAEVYATIIGDDARPEDEALNAIERVKKAAQVLRLEVDLYRAHSEELATTKRLFLAAAADLGAINEALGLDPEDGGAEPIIEAIEELKARTAAQPDERAALTNEKITQIAVERGSLTCDGYYKFGERRLLMFVRDLLDAATQGAKQ